MVIMIKQLDPFGYRKQEPTTFELKRNSRFTFIESTICNLPQFHM